MLGEEGNISITYREGEGGLVEEIWSMSMMSASFTQNFTQTKVYKIQYK